jgi:2-keto-4-pentenoate hydratase
MIDHESVAAALAQAAATRTPIAPLTETYPGFGVDDAYAVQSLVIAGRRAAGGRPVGWKVGLTSAAMQRQLGVEEPDFGPLLDDMAMADGGIVDPSTLIAPRVEAELAFRLGRELRGPGVTLDAALAAIEAVVPALEVIDSRIADWRIALPDTIADHASCAGFVVGGPGCALDSVDVRAVTVDVRQDGESVGRGAGSDVLGHPVKAVAWLAETLAGYGEHLRAGDIVLAGSLHASLPLVPGSTVEAVFSDPTVGTVSLRVAGERETACADA